MLSKLLPTFTWKICVKSPPCARFYCDAKTRKVLVLGHQGMTFVPNTLHIIIRFVSPGSFTGRQDTPVSTCAFPQPLWNWKKAQILTLQCILEHAVPVAMSPGQRKLVLLTFCTAQSRHCCCGHTPSLAASAKCCENFGTENVLSEASETHGRAEFLKKWEKENAEHWYEHCTQP